MNTTDIDKSMEVGFLFDLDGVLIDSESRYTEIWERIDAKFPTGVENFATKIKGTTLENILGTYYPDSATAAQVRAMLYEEEANMRYDYMQGAFELLNELSRLGIRAVLVTSSNAVKMDRLWAQRPELREYLYAIVDGDMVTRSKPDPQGYLLGASKMGLDPRRCVVFEDSLQGVKAGKAAGSYVVGIAGTLPGEALSGDSDVVVDNLTDISAAEICDILKKR